MDYINTTVSEISHILDIQYIGKDVNITCVKSISKISSGCLSFLRKPKNDSLPNKQALVIVPLDFKSKYRGNNTIIKAINPRLAYATVINKISKNNNKLLSNIKLEVPKSSKIGVGVIIGKNVIIGNNVVIGNNTIISAGCIIEDDVKIGSNCKIGPNSCIGVQGFAIEADYDNSNLVEIHHIGSVIIGDNVSLGALCTIARGTIDNTIVSNSVKISQNVNISHNVYIGDMSIITAKVQISGSVVIGKKVWIGPNASIVQGRKIGDNCKIGIGSVVVSNVEHGKTVMSLDAIHIEEFLKLKNLSRK